MTKLSGLADILNLNFRIRSAVLGFHLSLVACASVHALTITANFDSSITGDPNALAIETGINSAIATYETLFLNPINVTITFSNITTGLGGSSTFTKTDTYTDFLTKLTSSQTSAADATALANLPSGPNNPVNANANLTLSTANANALGIFMGSSSIGGHIFLNTSLMNLSRTTTDPAKYDLIGVVEHEMDEVLGLGSALVNGSNGQSPPTGPINPMDLYRYDQNGARSFSTGTDATTQAYFSLDGTTHLARFNQTSNTTFGGDFGDWYSFSGGQTPQVQDAFGTPGVIVNVGTAEKTAFDVIGYTLLAALTWNPNSANVTVPPDGGGIWTAASGSNWWSGTSNSVWGSGTVQNAKFGTAGTASSTPFTVTLGSAITVATLTFANQNYTVAGGGNSLTVNSGILSVANGTISAPVILGGANSWETTGTSTLTVSGNVSGGFGITKQGPGTLVLSGSNSYTGGTTVNSGTLLLGSAGALPTASNVIVSGGALDVNGQTPSIGNLTFGDGGSTFAGSVIDSASTKGSMTLAGDITYVETYQFGTSYFPAATIAANVQLAAGTHHITSADTVLAHSYDIIVSGALTGPGGVTKEGTNSYIALTGPSTYSGPTVINSGNFYGAAVNALSPNSAVTVNSPAILSIQLTFSQGPLSAGSYDQSIGSLAGSGAVLIDKATLTVGNDGTSTEYSGSISGASGGLIKTGAGTFILSGNSGYFGATLINGGTLQLGNGGANGFINNSSSISGLAGGTLSFNHNTVTNFSQSITGAINVAQNGTGVLLLNAVCTYTGTTTANTGNIFFGGNGTVLSGDIIDNKTVSFGNSATVSGAISGTGAFNVSGGTVVLTAANTYQGNTLISAGTLQLGNGGTSGSISSGVVISGSGTLVFNRSDAFTFGNIFNGSSGFAKMVQNGTGTTILSGANSGYSGTVTVNAGTLLVTGSIFGSTVNVNSGATLAGASAAVGAVNLASGATFLPASSTAPGYLDTRSLSLALGSHFSLELGGVTGTRTFAVKYSELSVLGTVSLAGDLQISLFGSYVPTVNDTFYIILNDGSDLPTGTFSNAVGGVIAAGGVQYQVDYQANGDGGATANDVSLKVIAVPEPGVGALLLAGFALGLGCKRQRRVRLA